MTAQHEMILHGSILHITQTSPNNESTVGVIMEGAKKRTGVIATGIYIYIVNGPVKYTILQYNDSIGLLNKATDT